MSTVTKNVKDAETAMIESDDWLAKQTRIAAENLMRRPEERRGPYSLSDEDICEKFSLNQQFHGPLVIGH